MKQFAVKDIASLFANDTEIKVSAEGFAFPYEPSSPIDVAAYGNMCVKRIHLCKCTENGVELVVLCEPVMCG